MSKEEEYRLKRVAKRIKIKELSELLDCSIGLISNWENGRGRMSPEKVNRYMEYIDLKGE